MASGRRTSCFSRRAAENSCASTSTSLLSQEAEQGEIGSKMLLPVSLAQETKALRIPNPGDLLVFFSQEFNERLDVLNKLQLRKLHSA